MLAKLPMYETVTSQSFTGPVRKRPGTRCVRLQLLGVLRPHIAVHKKGEY